MPRVLFCFYPIPVRWNHGIAVLSQLCKQQGIETEVYVLKFLSDFQDHIRANEYDVISFSAVIKKDFDLQIPFIQAALDLGLKVALGGTYHRRNNPSLFDGECFICRGEGELFPAFVLSGDTTIFETNYTCSDIESLPLPDYDLFKDIPYDREIPSYPAKRMIPYYSSRGCPYKCNFCEIQHQTGKVRIRRKVGDDLQYIVDTYKPELLFIGDELIPYYDKGWRDSWGDFRFPFFCYIRADIPQEHLEFLIAHGLEGCAFGVESGDEGHRNEVLGKNLTDEQIFRTVDILKKHNKHYVTFYMSATKGETMETTRATEKFIKNIGGEYYWFDYANIQYNVLGR